MIDWRLANRVAGLVAGESDAGPPLPGDLHELGAAAGAAVISYTRLVPLAPLPPAEAVGRDVWARANVALLRETIAPVTERLDQRSMPAPLRSLAGGAVAAEIGGLLGYMGRRVLGQYEVSLTPRAVEAPPRLLLVTPNLRNVAGVLGAPLEDLLAWVMVHEVTHAVQFSSVPWLRPYLGGLVGELLDSTDVDLKLGAPRIPSAEEVRGLWDSARDGGLMTMVAGPERRELLARVQSAMALVEGHAEHVMDAAGAPLVPSLDRLRSAMDRRRSERPPVAAVIERLLGLEMKLRQYQDGKRFCDAVVAREGIDTLNRAWESPEQLPSVAELADPVAWLRRTAA